MNSFDPQYWVTRAFIRLRQQGFQLGVGEMLIAYKAVEEGFGDHKEALAETLKILWCHSLSEQSQFDLIWESLPIKAEPEPLEKPLTPGKKPKPPIEHEEKNKDSSVSSSPKEVVTEIPSKAELSSLPIQAPFYPVEHEDVSVLQAYYPISRRSMVYRWRYLRRLVADGPIDVLDKEATIERVTQQGFYLAPVYRRREQNHARLLLLIDQNGSMTPFHRFSRELVETARYESSLQPENVNVFYFHNFPASNLYKDVYLTQPISLQAVLATCDKETSVLLVSDAGAARGYRKLARIRATTSFLFKLKRYTTLIAWLNPMPEDRWLGSSAEIIANLVPMYQMDDYGLSNAIDIIRGQPL